MSTSSPLIFSTRSLPAPLSKKLKKHKIQLQQTDFIKVTQDYNKESFINYLNNPDSQARVITSKNAVRSLAEILESEKIELTAKKNFVVGIKASEMLEELGIPVHVKAENAISLAQIIARNRDIKAVDYFCGNKALDDLPEYLNSKGIELHKEIVYQTELTPEVVETDAFNGIIFLSPTAVYSFFKKNKLNVETPCFCIGATTSEAIHFRCDNPRIPSDEPTLESVIDKIIAYYK